jgi:hypothetical protein
MQDKVLFPILISPNSVDAHESGIVGKCLAGGMGYLGHEENRTRDY